MTVIAWTEIESFHNIRKFTKAYPELLKGEATVKYRAKVKLHGTNAGVQVHSDLTLIAQSRTTELSATSDNAGFYKWVDQHKDAWKACAPGFIYYGEWFGPGIQKGVACSEVPEKSFAIFAARDLLDPEKLIFEPELLAKMSVGIPNVYVLPWYGDAIEVGWADSAEVLEKEVALINTWVNNVEVNDPWVEATFGVKGTGEGLVFYPTSTSHLGTTNFNNLVFKAKGEKHKNIKSAAPAQVDASAAANINQFVDMVLTDARLEQGATAVAGTLTFDMKLVGKFIAWVVADVQKETQDELEASKLEWKQVSKPVGDKARSWYMAKAKQL